MPAGDGGETRLKAEIPISAANTVGSNLLISDKEDVERDALAAVFEARGGAVHGLGRFWAPPSFEPTTVRIYGADSFCLVLQQKLGFSLCSPDDELLLRVPEPFLKRRLAKQTLADVQAGPLPAFIKPVVPKQFRGAVYVSADELAEECRGLPADTAVMVSEMVKLTAEVRCFVLNNEVLDAAVYKGAADRGDGMRFATEVANAVALPRAVVLDLGHISERGWTVVEFNAAWGAGLNGCDSEKVSPAVLAASGPQSS